MVVPNSHPIETQLFKLMADKERLESQINTYGEILVQNSNVGMSGPLIDAEGFPRNDIDVYQVRQARQQIICLQNDHRALMNDIEHLMHQLHANSKQAQTSQFLSRVAQNINMDDDSEEMVENLPRPILKVTSVSPGSPAEEAGIRENDEICKFGTADASNFNNNLEIIGNIVQNMRDRRIPIEVFRNNEILSLILVPKAWSGRGLLGCNIILTNNVK